MVVIDLKKMNVPESSEIFALYSNRKSPLG
jgi:hypothetical protein